MKYTLTELILGILTILALMSVPPALIFLMDPSGDNSIFIFPFSKDTPLHLPEQQLRCIQGVAKVLFLRIIKTTKQF